MDDVMVRGGGVASNNFQQDEVELHTNLEVADMDNQIGDMTDAPLVQIRSYFPETWLWMIRTTR